MDKRANERGLALGLGMIGIIVGLSGLVFMMDVYATPPQKGLGTALMGMYLMSWGFMFLASYYYSHKCFFFRGLIWICEHFSRPEGRWMAFFYFAIAFFVGGMIFLVGLGAFPMP